MIKVIAIQEQSINSNILLRGKMAFHVSGFVITIDLSMVMKSTAACDAKKKPSWIEYKSRGRDFSIVNSFKRNSTL